MSFRLRAALTAVLAAAPFAACSDSTSPSVPATVSLVSGGWQTAVAGTPLSAPVVLRVTDNAGRPFRGAAVTFAVTKGSGRVTSSAVASDDSGFVKTAWTVGTNASEEQSLTASVAGLPPVIVNATAIADAPVALRVVRISASARTGVALAQPPAVSVVDQYGNSVGVPNLPVEVTFSGAANGREFVGSTTATTDGTGIATFQGFAIKGATGSVGIGFSCGALHGAASTITLLAGPPATIEAVGGTTLAGDLEQAGSTLRVRALDSGGNGASGATIEFLNGSTGVPTNVVADSNGIAVFSGWSYPSKAGTFEITASVAGDTRVAPVTFTVAVRAGTPADLKFVGDSVLAGGAGEVAAPISVRARDARGNAVQNAAVAFTLAGNTIATMLTGTDGVATLKDWKLPSAIGAYAVSATLLGLPKLDVPVTVTLGPPRRIVLTSGPSSATVGTFVQLFGLLTDAGGNAVQNSTIAWGAPDGDAIYSGTTSVSDVDGMFSVRYRLTSKPGVNVLNATLASGSRVSFSVRAVAGPTVAFVPLIVNATAAPGALVTVQASGVDSFGNASFVGNITTQVVSGNARVFITSEGTPGTVAVIAGTDAVQQVRITSGTASMFLVITRTP